MKNKKRSMGMLNRLAVLAMVTALLVTACKKDKDNNPADDKVVVIDGNGNIDDPLSKFRTILGGSLNTTPGSVGGYREVNWDAVPDSMLGKALPNDFFNTVGPNVPASRQRGLAYDPVSGEFRVSATAFIEVNATTAGEFGAFSGNKTFANVSADLWQITPQVAGLAEAATVRGFGIVFSDVDEANSTFLEYFDGSKSLGKFFVPAHNSQSSFSFLGVYFKEEKVTAIKVGHKGTLASGGKDVSDGGTSDLVILDNFLYDEPVKRVQ
jgi:hypothetical protein